MNSLNSKNYHCIKNIDIKYYFVKENTKLEQVFFKYTSFSENTLLTCSQNHSLEMHYKNTYHIWDEQLIYKVC